MPWTQAQQIRHLAALPWTIIAEATAEGDRVLRVAELPSAFAVVGPECTNAELESEFWAALTDVLRSYLHFGDAIPLPANVNSLPWDAAATPLLPARYVAPLGGGVALPPPAYTATVGNVNRDALAPA